MVTRFACDSEFTVLALRLRCGQIFHAPVRICNRVRSTISPGAVFHLLWGTLAAFYQVRILHCHEKAGPWDRMPLLQELPAPLGGD